MEVGGEQTQHGGRTAAQLTTAGVYSIIHVMVTAK